MRVGKDEVFCMQKIIVIKIGTSVLTNGAYVINHDVLRFYARECKILQQQGYASVFVTSGAVQLGRGEVSDIADKKILAAVGQVALSAAYREAFAQKGLVVAQLLCSRHDIAKRHLFQAFQQTLAGLIALGIIPLLNENDALTNGEIESFGNNDALAAVAAVAMSAEKLLLLTDQEGLYTADPRSLENAQLVREVGDVTKELFEYCSASASRQGVGGMIAKLKAAKTAIAGGVETIIARGNIQDRSHLADILAHKGLLTYFRPRRTHDALINHDRWILATQPSGALRIDKGAATALRNRKSLLAVGIRNITGEFQQGEIVRIIDHAKEEIGCGIVSLSSDALKTMLAKGSTRNTDVIHCDHLIMY